MKVWDLSTRLYHWLQAILFVALIISGFAGNNLHIQWGLILLTLVVWRIVWGIIGSQTSRFSQFVRSPTAVLRYLSGKEVAKPGHNPAGAWMVITMITTLFLQCISGLALAGLLDNLPYAEYWLTDSLFTSFEMLHFALANALPLLVVIHIAAIIIYKFRRQPLIMTMITGVQRKITPTDELYFISQWRALIVLVASVFVTIAIVALA